MVLHTPFDALCNDLCGEIIYVEFAYIPHVCVGNLHILFGQQSKTHACLFHLEEIVNVRLNDVEICIFIAIYSNPNPCVNLERLSRNVDLQMISPPSF